MVAILKNLYFTQRFYLGLILLILFFAISYAYPGIYWGAILLFGLFILLLIFEIFLNFRHEGVIANRQMADRFSNGDENPIEIKIENAYDRDVLLRVIDEIPSQFQKRDLTWSIDLTKGSKEVLTYALRPVKRGIYHFGLTNIFVSQGLRLTERRFRFGDEKEVTVYPSFLQMRKYELAAISNQLTQLGIKKIRRIGHSMEFEQIKDYVRGDDPRNINWKATARSRDLMVNQFQDERSQQVYSIIDKGRLMKMPFDGMSLLDYAINACLVISNIAIKKGDKSGFITFSKKISTVINANKKTGQMSRIMEGLYNQKTRYEESNFELLSRFVHSKLNERSLLLFFTNFESIHSMRRQLPYLQILSKRHVLIVIFFRNTELKEMIEKQPKDLEEIYQQTVAEHLDHEKDLMIKELRQYGITGVVTEPDKLTVETINQYLKIKARGF